MESLATSKKNLQASWLPSRIQEDSSLQAISTNHQQSNDVHDHDNTNNESFLDMAAMTSQNFQQIIQYLQTQIPKAGISKATTFVNSIIVPSGARQHLSISCPYTPEKTSVLERKHQHLLNVARSLMFQAKVPIKFWGDYIATTTFIINKTMSVVLNSKSTYELLYDKPPAYSEFRVFGCLCYISTIPQHRNKLTPRVIPCVFLGYPVGYKGFKVYDLVSNTFHVSRDIVFHEDTFPFHSLSDNNIRDDPFHNIVLPSSISDHLPYDIDDFVPKNIDAHHQNPNPAKPITTQILLCQITKI
ncbi:hypothetical protein KIW84_014461 [Lathyrus oleraceus]|uniref:Retroviral polymerase SH3-like domain-containing protein n=1 Tax=Pisum sativum TaxID=3888 RepID=A0A9D5GZ89_PEA|nr:hypothetical protein KIW84_014461 [Pisum sativum]